MIHHKRSSLIWLFVGIYMLASFTGCAMQAPKSTPTDEMLEDAILRTITTIEDYADVKGYHLRIESTEKLLFTAVKQVDPPAVTFYFLNTEAHLIRPLPTQFNAPLKAIILKPLGEQAKTLRMDLILTEDVPYAVNQVNSHLQVTLPNQKGGEKTALFVTPKPDAELSDQLDSKIETRLTAVEAFSENGLTFVRIGTSKEVTDVQKSTLNDPPRIVVDLYGIADQHTQEQVKPIHLPGVRQIRYFGDGRKLRVVIDTQVDILERYSVTTRSDGVLIAINHPAPVAIVEKVSAPTAAADLGAKIADSKYSGEKIALNLHDADIRNLFKILADVSGENFAIDKEVTGRVTLTLDRPVPWDQVLDLVLKMNRLEKRVEEGIIRIATLEALTLEEQARAERQKVRRALENQADLTTEYITANYADAEKNIKPHLEAILTKNMDGTPRGTLSVDTRNNVLIITDLPTTIERAKEIVRELDRVTPQVLIEARVVEANTDLSQSLGISWSMAGGIPNDSPSAGFGPQRGFGNVGGTYGWDTAINFPVANAPTIGFNFSRILGSPFLLDMQLSALEEQGSARIISAPRILTLDNQEALIQQGEEYPYRDTRESTDGTSGVVVTKFKDIDLKLKVRPHITPDQRISMKVFIEKKDIAGFVQTESGTLIPRINSKKAETEFLMNDGDTIVIGGINRTTERISQSGLPLLSRIPILGWLFKTKAKKNNKEELLIFITPKISRLGQKAVTSKLSGQTTNAF